MLLGWLFIAVGILGLAFPFMPGIIPIFFGVSLITFNSRWVHKQGARLRAQYPELAHSLKQFEMFWIDRLHLSTHTHDYLQVPSRHGDTIQALVEVSHHNDVGVAVVLHSASGTLETSVQSILADVCKAQGYTVVRFDARNGLNENGTTYTDFTVSAYREDLEDVLRWARTQSWWRGPLVLAGHSAGALVAILYAEEHPGELAALLLLAPTVSGATYYSAFQKVDPEGLTKWREGRLRTVRHPLSGEVYSLSYAFVEDLLRYDALPKAHTLTMPVTIVAGSHDVTSPVDVCTRLRDAVGNTAHLIVVPGMPHTPEEHKELQSLTSALYAYMKS